MSSKFIDFRDFPNHWFSARQREDVTTALRRVDEEDLSDIEGGVRPLGIVNGAFDLLHPGHLRLIGEARWRSGTLVGLLDSDDKVRREKGPKRPVLSWPRRATSLFYLGVDWIFEITSDEDFLTVCTRLDPDFRVLGGEYKGKKTRVPWIPQVYVRDTGFHTSDIVRSLEKDE